MFAYFCFYFSIIKPHDSSHSHRVHTPIVPLQIAAAAYKYIHFSLEKKDVEDYGGKRRSVSGGYSSLNVLKIQ